MPLPTDNATDLTTTIDRLWEESGLVALFLHDSRKSHRAVAAFLRESGSWLDELARQSGLTILFPLQRVKRGYRNPSPVIAREFGLQANRLPGIVLFSISNTKGRLANEHYIFIPLKDVDFKDIEGMQATVADIFSIVHIVLGDGADGREALEQIKQELSRRRKQKSRDNLIQALRKGAHVVLKRFPEKIIASFVESLAKIFL
jgi:hypothetical protein